jgi:glycosyltransferase involved in cell wall biosynthesis
VAKSIFLSGEFSKQDPATAMCSTDKSGYEFTVAVCNHNMESTVETALRSILDQVTDDYEVLVVDDSTDSSPELIRALEEKYENLRLVRLKPADRTLAEARNESIRKARGTHVMMHVDADDYYYDGTIVDIGTTYHRLRERVSEDFFFSCHNLNVAPREFLLEEYMFKTVAIGAEDYELWWRLLANEDIICLDHEPICREIERPERKRGLEYKLNRSFDDYTGKFQVGAPFTHILFDEIIWNPMLNWKGKLVGLALAPPAFVRAMFEESYEPPTEDWSNIRAEFERVTYSVPELEREFGVTVAEGLAV